MDEDEKEMPYYAEFSGFYDGDINLRVYLLDESNLDDFADGCDEKYPFNDISVIPLEELDTFRQEAVIKACLYRKPEKILKACTENWVNVGYPTNSLKYYVVLSEDGLIL